MFVKSAVTRNSFIATPREAVMRGSNMNKLKPANRLNMSKKTTTLAVSVAWKPQNAPRLDVRLNDVNWSLGCVPFGESQNGF